jgi:hypothetical protein
MIGRDLTELHQPQKLFGDEFYKLMVAFGKPKGTAKEWS